MCSSGAAGTGSGKHSGKKVEFLSDMFYQKGVDDASHYD
jgi:hypothetical protein